MGDEKSGKNSGTTMNPIHHSKFYTEIPITVYAL